MRAVRADFPYACQTRTICILDVFEPHIRRTIVYDRSVYHLTEGYFPAIVLLSPIGYVTPGFVIAGKPGGAALGPVDASIYRVINLIHLLTFPCLAMAHTLSILPYERRM